MKDFFKNSEIQNMYIEFAKHSEKGKVSVLVSENKIELREIKCDYLPVGINFVEPDDCYDQPCLQLVFHSVDSINIIIEALETVKSNIIEDSQSMMAC